MATFWLTRLSSANRILSGDGEAEAGEARVPMRGADMVACWPGMCLGRGEGEETRVGCRWGANGAACCRAAVDREGAVIRPSRCTQRRRRRRSMAMAQ